MIIIATAISPRNKQNLQVYAQNYRIYILNDGNPRSPKLPESVRFGEFGERRGGRMKKSIYNDRAISCFAVVSEALLLSSFVWLHYSAISFICEWTMFFYPYTKWYLYEKTNIPDRNRSGIPVMERGNLYGRIPDQMPETAAHIINRLDCV